MDTWLKREGKTPLFIFFRPLAIGKQKSILPVRACVCVHGKRALPYLTHGLERHAYATPPWVQNLWVGEIERSSESRQPMRSMRSRSPDRVPHGFDDGVLPLPSRCIAIGHHHNEPNQGQIRPGTKGKKPTNHTDGQNPPQYPGPGLVVSFLSLEAWTMFQEPFVVHWRIQMGPARFWGFWVH